MATSLKYGVAAIIRICVVVYADDIHGCLRESTTIFDGSAGSQKEPTDPSERTCQPPQPSGKHDDNNDPTNDWEDTSLLMRSSRLLKDYTDSSDTSESSGGDNQQRRGVTSQIGVRAKSSASGDKEGLRDSEKESVASRSINLTEFSIPTLVQSTKNSDTSEAGGSDIQHRPGVTSQIGIGTTTNAYGNNETLGDSENEGIARHSINSTAGSTSTRTESWHATMLIDIARSGRHGVDRASVALSSTGGGWNVALVILISLVIACLYACTINTDAGFNYQSKNGTVQNPVHRGSSSSVPSPAPRGTPAFGTARLHERLSFPQLAQVVSAVPSMQSLPTSPQPLPTSPEPVSRSLTPGMTAQLDDIPPPLCKPLVLNDTVTRIQIPKLQLHRAADPSLSVEGVEFDIDGQMRKSIFRVSVVPDPEGGKALGVSLPWNGVVPWTVVRPLNNADSAVIQHGRQTYRKFEIIGRDRTKYGLMTVLDGLRSAVVHRSMKKFNILRDPATDSITVTSMNGIVMASLDTMADDADLTELTVNCGVCSLLMLSCIIGSLTLTT